MIKEKLMKALKTAAEDYNGGMSANAAVACAAEAYDFNEKQAERLTEMFNTTLALKKQKDADDPAGSCELAEKSAVARMLMKDCAAQKTASAPLDYSFYSIDPERTNATMESRRSGRASMMKAAAPREDNVPDELKVSQRSLYKIIEGKIGMLKDASSAADDVVRNIRMFVDRESVKIARVIEDPFADPDIADMFKAACPHDKAVKSVSEYSTKVAESDGGRFSRMHVFDSSAVDALLKKAEEIERHIGLMSEYERKRDLYMAKAAEFHEEMLKAVGLVKSAEEGAGTIAGMFQGVRKPAGEAGLPESGPDADICVKLAEMVRESGVSAEEVGRLAEDLEKDAVSTSFTNVLSVPTPSMSDAASIFSSGGGSESDEDAILNVRRSIILADLMSNDPIIRDADPDNVIETYKMMVMTAPRVSLDKAQVRAVLRNAVNSIAVSPSDAKVISDVDRGVAMSNIERLTNLDSSIKDSNRA